MSDDINAKQLYTFLYDVRPHWYEIGVLLDIDITTLNVIFAREHDAGKCILAVIGLLLKQDPLITWSDIVYAVCHRAGGNSTRLAKKIADEHGIDFSAIVERYIHVLAIFMRNNQAMIIILKLIFMS